MPAALKPLVLVALLAPFALVAGSADAADAKGHHHHAGTIVGLQLDGNGKGTLILRVHTHHKPGQVSAAAVTDHKFIFSVMTTVEIVGKNHHRVLGSLANLKIGEHVNITAHHHFAEIVVIHQPRKF